MPTTLRDQLGTSLNGDHRFDRFNPAAGLTWRLGRGLTAYAGYAEASRTPTPAELSCASPEAPCSLTDFFLSDPPLKLVTADTWEAGLRGRQKRGDLTLSWSAACSTPTRATTSAGWRAMCAGAGSSRTSATAHQGVEAQTELSAGRWRGYATYAFTDATLPDAADHGEPRQSCRRRDGQIYVRPGDRMPGVARQRVKAGVTYARRTGVSPWTPSPPRAGRFGGQGEPDAGGPGICGGEPVRRIPHHPRP